MPNHSRPVQCAMSNIPRKCFTELYQCHVVYCQKMKDYNVFNNRIHKRNKIFKPKGRWQGCEVMITEDELIYDEVAIWAFIFVSLSKIDKYIQKPSSPKLSSIMKYDYENRNRVMPELFWRWSTSWTLYSISSLIELSHYLRGTPTWSLFSLRYFSWLSIKVFTNWGSGFFECIKLHIPFRSQLLVKCRRQQLLLKFCTGLNSA